MTTESAGCVAGRRATTTTTPSSPIVLRGVVVERLTCATEVTQIQGMRAWELHLRLGVALLVPPPQSGEDAVAPAVGLENGEVAGIDGVADARRRWVNETLAAVWRIWAGEMGH
jgi:hypothetical protein